GVEPLAGQVPRAVAAPDLVARAEEVAIAVEGAPEALLGPDDDEDAQIPGLRELGPEQEDAVERAGRRRLPRPPAPRGRSGPCGSRRRPSDTSGCRGAERVEQRLAERRVVEGILVIALGRVRAAAVAGGAG